MVVGRRRLLLASSAVAVLGVAGCVSPTLPLPPPELPAVSQGTAPGRYVLSGAKGAALADAFVIAINESARLPRDQRVAGTQADPDGSYRIELYASPGDRIDLTQERGNERSPPVSVQIPR
ncbi:MAG: hypothetical protein U0183_26640 [Polyangiaceae bacterium]|jgi:hypothetical protein